MVQKFGVSMPDDLAADVEEPLEFGDSRSDRICDLVELGILLEEIADSHDVEIPEGRRDRRAWLNQLFIDASE